MGKTKRFAVKNPNDPASDGQTYALHTICGVDVREMGLLAGNASDLIDAAKNGQSRHVRMALIDAGAIVRKRDVHKNFRNDPKPKGYKVEPEPVKAKGNGKTNEEILMELIRQNPELIKKALMQIAGADVEQKPKPKPKPKAEAKPAVKVDVKKKTTPKKTAKTTKKAAPKVEAPKSDDDLLSSLMDAIKAQAS